MKYQISQFKLGPPLSDQMTTEKDFITDVYSIEFDF